MHKLVYIITFFLMTSCSLSPGMHFKSDQSWLTEEESVYIESLKQDIRISEIKEYLDIKPRQYKLGIGDQIGYFVWGIPDVFPTVNMSPDQNLRRVDSYGNIYFPYVGVIQAKDKTISDLRSEVTEKMSVYFNEPQVDLTIARFNSQYVYILGEVMKPKKLSISDIPLSLSDAIGEVYGIDRNSAQGAEVYIIRNANNKPEIYKADLSSPSGFLMLVSSIFYLMILYLLMPVEPQGGTGLLVNFSHFIIS